MLKQPVTLETYKGGQALSVTVQLLQGAFHNATPAEKEHSWTVPSIIRIRLSSTTSATLNNPRECRHEEILVTQYLLAPPNMVV